MDDQNKTPPGTEQNTGEANQNEQLALENNAGDSNEGLKLALLKATKDLEAANKKIQAAEAAKLEASGNFKKLWEDERKRVEELEGKLNRNTAAFIETQKRTTLKDQLIKAGMRSDAMKLADTIGTDGLEVEVTDQGFTVLGADTVVSKMRQEFPFMFSKAEPTVNSGTGAGGTTTSGGPITAKDLLVVEKKFGPGSKEYRESVMTFLSQKKK